MIEEIQKIVTEPITSGYKQFINRHSGWKHKIKQNAKKKFKMLQPENQTDGDML